MLVRGLKPFLALSTALLVGCTQTSDIGYTINGIQVYSTEWPVSGGTGQEVVQRSDHSQEVVGAGPIYGSPEPEVTNNGNFNAATVIAVLAVLVLVALADDATGCTGSGCSSSGAN